MNLTALLFGYAVAILVSNLYIMLSLCMGRRVGNSFTVYTVLLVDLVPIIYIAMPKSCDVTESILRSARARLQERVGKAINSLVPRPIFRMGLGTRLSW